MGWHHGGLCAKTGLVCSFRTWLTILGPAQVIHNNKAQPNVPMWKLQGQSWFVRAGMLWTEYLPPVPSLLAVSSGGPTPEAQTEPLWSDHPSEVWLEAPTESRACAALGSAGTSVWVTAVCSSFAFA